MKIKFLNLELNLANNVQQYRIAEIGRALSSPARVRILRLLYRKSMTISEVAAAMRLSVSSATFHLKILRDAGLLSIVYLPSKKGRLQICQLKMASLLFYFSENTRGGEDGRVSARSVPVGQYVDARLDFVSGFCTPSEQVMFDDGDYYPSARMNAQLLWCKSGFVTYAFSNTARGAKLKEIRISLEICSETLNYQNDWKSDITFSLNGAELLTYTSPGDFGERRGRLNPDWWPNNSTQYGELKEIAVNRQGCFLNGILKNRQICIGDLDEACERFLFRVENKPDAQFRGGFNIFGSGFGDYPQDIRFSVEREEPSR